MEGRKIQITGGSTYVVSLPKPWVLAAGLKAGDTVFLDPRPDGSVVVLPRPADRPAARRKIFDIKAEETRDHLLRKLIGSYIAGYGLIEVRFGTDMGPPARRVVREFCRMAIGPEIIEETRNSIVVQDLSDPAELSPEKSLRRMYMTARAMLEDAVLSLKKGDDALSRDVLQRDQEVDRLYWLVAKQYHLAHAIPSAADPRARIGLVNVHLVAKLLERIGDHAARIAGVSPAISVKGLDPKLAKELDAATKSAVQILDDAFHALVTLDIDAANRTVDARVPHQRMVDGLSHHVATRKGEELLALGTVVDSLGRTAGYATDIAEIAINQAVLADGETK